MKESYILEINGKPILLNPWNIDVLLCEFLYNGKQNREEVIEIEEDN